jgi:hypothetical protein
MTERVADRSALLESAAYRLKEIELEICKINNQLQQLAGLVGILLKSEKSASEKPTDYIHDIENEVPYGVQFTVGRGCATVSLLDCGLMEMTDEHHDIILIEYQNGEPKLYVWNDINSADPVMVSLERAKLKHRSE